MPLPKPPDVASAEQVRISFGGWGMRIEFVPNDELDKRPKLKVREPPASE